MKKRFRFALAIVATCLTFGNIAAVDAADKLEGIPLKWDPTSPMSERKPVDVKGLETIKLQIEPFTDPRENPGFIGQNRDRVPVRKVTTREDVARFVTYRVKTLMSDVGLDVVESGGDVILKGELKKFFVDETSRYNAEVQFEVTFTDASGKVLWVVLTTGTSSRYGISYKGGNYYEVLSDALIGATHELISNPGFRKALTAK
jgi:hypothetical protein